MKWERENLSKIYSDFTIRVDGEHDFKLQKSSQNAVYKLLLYSILRNLIVIISYIRNNYL